LSPRESSAKEREKKEGVESTFRSINSSLDGNVSRKKSTSTKADKVEEAVKGRRKKKRKKEKRSPAKHSFNLSSLLHRRSRLGRYNTLFSTCRISCRGKREMLASSKPMNEPICEKRALRRSSWRKPRRVGIGGKGGRRGGYVLLHRD